jgi:ketosteroid isomerase-like protein
MKPLLAVLGVALLACAAEPTESPSSLREAEQVLEDYRQAWLADDSARVMSHVSDEFAMMTPVRTVSGKEHVRVYWYPSRDTTYPIRKYDVTSQRVYGSGEYIVAEGLSFLAWDTKVKDSVVASATSKSEYINVLRREAGAWKLYRSIFVMR